MSPVLCNRPGPATSSYATPRTSHSGPHMLLAKTIGALLFTLERLGQDARRQKAKESFGHWHGNRIYTAAATEKVVASNSISTLAFMRHFAGDTAYCILPLEREPREPWLGKSFCEMKVLWRPASTWVKGTARRRGFSQHQAQAV